MTRGRKLEKQADPLRVRASRVEKSGHTQRSNRTLPPWYYRVLAIGLKEDREVCGEDFDEDLSELEDDDDEEQGSDGVEQSEEEDCACGGDDPECDCQDDDDDESDSERSYDGSDADYYYELKEEREERKQEKLEERKEKEQLLEIEKTMEDEVCAAHRSLDAAEEEGREPNPVGSLAGQSFKLYCSDHVDYFYSDFYATKRVDFFHPDEDQRMRGDEADALYAHVHLDSNANCNFGPFRPPKLANQKAFRVKSEDNKYELSLQFIGNGYLKLRVSREMVFMKPHNARRPPPPPAAPEVFEFAGILRDLEKEKAEQNARRPPSPRETWFEMNHPMGWWAQGSWVL